MRPRLLSVTDFIFGASEQINQNEMFLFFIFFQTKRNDTTVCRHEFFARNKTRWTKMKAEINGKKQMKNQRLLRKFYEILISFHLFLQLSDTQSKEMKTKQVFFSSKFDGMHHTQTHTATLYVSHNMYALFQCIS